MEATLELAGWVVVEPDWSRYEDTYDPDGFVEEEGTDSFEVAIWSPR